MREYKYDPHERCLSCNRKYAKLGGCIACQRPNAYFEQGWLNE